MIDYVPSFTGGGWIYALTEEGDAYLLDYFGEEPQPLKPLGGIYGYIAEPYDLEGLAYLINIEDIQA